MFKFLFPLAALLVSVPAQAQSISYERMKELSDQAKVVCPIAVKNGDNAISTIYRLIHTDSLEEKFFVITLCQFYVNGKIDGLTV